MTAITRPTLVLTLASACLLAPVGCKRQSQSAPASSPGTEPTAAPESANVPDAEPPVSEPPEEATGVPGDPEPATTQPGEEEEEEEEVVNAYYTDPEAQKIMRAILKQVASRDVSAPAPCRPFIRKASVFRFLFMWPKGSSTRAFRLE